ncbi:hypothetical protein LTS18_009544, partial [Coniosporium uncinatum]
PEDSANDPLNWPTWKRDAALLSLGFYCMVGGGMTPILAAGFNDVAATYDVSVPQVALTTGLYMMGLGVGSVVASPTAILFGKRPVYLITAILFLLTSVWCALSPNYDSLLIARIIQGVAVSPVECLPSATVAEIFFLHERAYRLGIYTLLLLGGKNLVPLISAAIIETLHWRWVFWIVTIIVGFCFVLLFLFVPETFWDRTPRPRHMLKRSGSRSGSVINMFHSFGHQRHHANEQADGVDDHRQHGLSMQPSLQSATPGSPYQQPRHAHFQTDSSEFVDRHAKRRAQHFEEGEKAMDEKQDDRVDDTDGTRDAKHLLPVSPASSTWIKPFGWDIQQDGDPDAPPTPELRNLNSPFYAEKANEDADYFSLGTQTASPESEDDTRQETRQQPKHQASQHSQMSPASSPAFKLTSPPTKLKPSLKVPAKTPTGANAVSPFETEKTMALPADVPEPVPTTYVPLQTPPTPSHHNGADNDAVHMNEYTSFYREAPAKSFVQQLKPWNKRLRNNNWFRVATRPFILFAYPAVLWSTVVYSLSVGWLIVLSESVSSIYRNRDSYNFTALQTGLVYLSPFIGGVLGTAVAGKVSDVIVRFLSRRNDGVYEPEFRLVMTIPVAICTTIGLMGFGWSAEERDAWIVPTVFFGIISFGCSLGSTTAITFCVDSYRQYAGEALVTLNFSKSTSTLFLVPIVMLFLLLHHVQLVAVVSRRSNVTLYAELTSRADIFHGLVFSLFFTHWLEADGPKDVFVAVGGIQMACLLFTIPMYIFGKRARMWTVRKNLMEKF